ncbi:MAG TPA: glutamyl-tRNA reductase [Candidatus Xenobia bacterium]
MEIVLIGVNHKTAPVETRERLAIVDSRLESSLQSLVRRPGLQESVILSTCNRSEFYATGEAADDVAGQMMGYLQDEHGVPPEALARHHYHLVNDQVARHLFTVSCGLDSMIPGEGQILAQVRKAYQSAQTLQTTGTIFNKLFPWAVKVGKRARTETRIAQGAASIGFAAVELAKRVCGDLDGKHTLIAGAGKMGELTLKLLVHSGIKTVSVLNRTVERAERLAEKVGGDALPLTALKDTLVHADIAIFSTGAEEPVLTKADMVAVMRKRKNRPIFLIDIAVPRDVEARAGDLENVYLYNVDDLQSMVDQNVEERRREIARVEVIVGQELEEFVQYFRSLRAVPLIRGMRASFEQVRQQELEALLSRQNVSPEERKRLETFSHALLQKLLHKPTANIKALAQKPGDGLEALAEVFDLPPPEADEEDPS